MQRSWALADLGIVLLFVGIGRSVHDHGYRLAGFASTTWPFAVGLLLGWLALISRRHSGLSTRDGLVVTLFTVSVGMVLRVLADQGTAVAFIIVALIFLGGAMVGWRLVLMAARRRHSHNSLN
ncbi:MAG TPA: DUF3054 domain-containing protein [Acidimicrobiales bacterium]